MLISTREACEILAGVGISQRRGRHALAAGLAGAAVRTRGALLLDADRVRELAAREVLIDDDLDVLCPHGAFVARRNVPVSESRETQLAAVSDGWDDISVWTWLWIGWQLELHGHLPLVATVDGFVVLGADLVGCDPGRLDLHDPGAWFEKLEGRRLLTGPGRPWHVHQPGHGMRQLGLWT